jgi:hypothetical protein
MFFRIFNFLLYTTIMSNRLRIPNRLGIFLIFVGKIFYTARFTSGSKAIAGGRSLYITSVTKRANTVEQIRPPMITLRA